MNTDQKLIEKFIELHPRQAIILIEDLETQEIAGLLDSLSLDQSAFVLQRIVPYRAAKVIELLSRQDVSSLIEAIDISFLEAIFNQIEKGKRAELLDSLSDERKQAMERILFYSKSVIGAYIRATQLVITDDIQVEQGLEQLKKHLVGGASVIYVLDRENLFKGFVYLSELITSNKELPIRELIKKHPQVLMPEMGVKDILDLWQPIRTQLPVVNKQGVFLGIVEYNDIIDLRSGDTGVDQSAVKAGNALGELYMIGLSSLFGNSSESISGYKKTEKDGSSSNS